jgi:Gpi18-like mannosyltransferase
MVNLSYVPILDYIALIEDKLFSEPSNFILEKILENLYSCLEEFIAADVGYALRSKIFQRIYKELQIVADA